MWTSISICSCYQHEIKTNIHLTCSFWLSWRFPIFLFSSLPSAPFPDSHYRPLSLLMQSFRGMHACMQTHKLWTSSGLHSFFWGVFAISFPSSLPPFAFSCSFLPWLISEYFLIWASSSRIPAPTLWCDLKQDTQTLSAMIFLDSPVSIRY